MKLRKMALFRRVSVFHLPLVCTTPRLPSRSCCGDDTAVIRNPELQPVLQLFHARTSNSPLSGRSQAGIPRQRGYHQISISVQKGVHTWGVLGSKARSSEIKPKESKGEHGSVLTQIVGKKEDPKQLTVASRGQDIKSQKFLYL